jgi:ATP synthase, F1 delta subunit
MLVALELDKLDALYRDMQGLKMICDTSRDFTRMLKNPVIHSDAKIKVVKSLAEGKVEPVTLAFINLIINKGREAHLPEIIRSFISLYKQHNRIVDVTLTTAQPLDENLRQYILNQVRKQFPGMQVDMLSKVNDKIVGGFILEANNNVFDASILRDLQDIKKQFLKNEYVQNIR